MFECRKKDYTRKVLRSREILACSNNIRRRRGRRRVKPPKQKYIAEETSMEEKKPILEEFKEVKPLRKRFHRCCVPNCPTLGPPEEFLTFPSTDFVQRRAWLDAIPRRNWFVCHNTRICKNHFSGAATDKDVPTLFPRPTPPNLEDKYRKIDRGMLQSCGGNYALPETFGDLALVPNCDKFIFDFFSLLGGYKERLKVVLDVCRWLVREERDQLVFYRLYATEGCVKISTCVSIDAQMRPTVSLDGVIVDPLDCTRHVPVNGKITHWDQLNLMLLDYGYDREGIGKDKVPPLLVVNSDSANVS